MVSQRILAATTNVAHNRTSDPHEVANVQTTTPISRSGQYTVADSPRKNSLPVRFRFTATMWCRLETVAYFEPTTSQIVSYQQVATDEDEKPQQYVFVFLQ